MAFRVSGFPSAQVEGFTSFRDSRFGNPMGALPSAQLEGFTSFRDSRFGNPMGAPWARLGDSMPGRAGCCIQNCILILIRHAADHPNRTDSARGPN